MKSTIPRFTGTSAGLPGVNIRSFRLFHKELSDFKVRDKKCVRSGGSSVVRAGKDLTVQHQCVFLDEPVEEVMLGLDLYG